MAELSAFFAQAHVVGIIVVADIVAIVIWFVIMLAGDFDCTMRRKNVAWWVVMLILLSILVMMLSLFGGGRGRV